MRRNTPQMPDSPSTNVRPTRLLGSRDAADDVAEVETAFEQVVDPDVDLVDPPRKVPARGGESAVLGVIAIGGVIGAEARYGVGLLIPHPPGTFGWSTVLINATGCALLGCLMVVVLELTRPHRLTRPFLGVGVLGGYTTFSTFAVDVQTLVSDGRPTVGLAYWLTTLIAGWAAVWLGIRGTRRFGRRAVVGPR